MLRALVSSLRLSLLALPLGALGACAGVQPIDVHDERLPLDARLWVGGAEDAVSIARAAVDDARLALSELEAWEDALPGARDVGPSAAGLVKPLEALAAARITLAERRLDRAETDLELARAARDVVYAETAMRYDLAVHDLAALRATREGLQKSLEADAIAVDTALAELDRADGAFWSAYRGHAAGGNGDDSLLWLPVRREEHLGLSDPHAKKTPAPAKPAAGDKPAPAPVVDPVKPAPAPKSGP